MPEPLSDALAQLRPLLLDPQRLLRAVAAGRRRGHGAPPRKATLRPVSLKAGPSLQVVTYDERQAHTRNEPYGTEAERAVDDLLALPFGNWHVVTVEGTVQLRVTKKGAAQVHRSGPAPAQLADRAHDRVKPRLLTPGEPVFAALGLTTRDGQVKPSRQDKFRQVDEFLRSLEPALAALPDRPLRVVDLGCGNAYLTFAAYRFLTDVAGREVELIGVDSREQARDRNAKIAAELGWTDSVRFVEATILDAPIDGADVVLALHACDTATDEALARAVEWQAPVVLAAPCCHHDLQRQLAHDQAPAPYGMLTRHGILRERFADSLTDALRAALLRIAGYRVEVIEFVESRHTPRNTLLRGVYTGADASADVSREYAEMVGQWHVTPALSTLLRSRTALALPGAT